MKKVLSILLVLSMVCGLFTGTASPKASAAQGFAIGSVVATGDADLGLEVTSAATGINPTDGYVYADVDASGTVTPGDIRLTPAGAYAAGSVVAAGDSDVGVALTARSTGTPEWPAQNNTGKVYLDRPTLGTVNAADVRLTPIAPYALYTLVNAGDVDVNAALTVNPVVYVVSATNPLNLTGKPQVYFDYELGSLGATGVTAGMIRLTVGNFANAFVTTNSATAITATSAQMNGTNGEVAGTGHSYWYKLGSTFSTADPGNLDGATSTADFGAIAAGAAFTPADGTLTGLVPNSHYYFAAWSCVAGTWYPGAVLSFWTLPAAPTGLTAVPTCGHVSLTWDVVAPLTYKIRVTGVSPLVPPYEIDPATSPKDVILAAGTYTFAVAAHGTGGWSAWSAETAPVVVTTIPGAVVADVTTSGLSNTITWSAPVNNGGSAVTGYHIYWRLPPAAYDPAMFVSVPASQLSFVHTVASNPLSYRYKVLAVNACGEAKAFTEVNPALLPGVPAAPSIECGSTVVGATGTVHLYWTSVAANPAVTAYRITVTPAVAGYPKNVGNVTDYLVSGLTNGTTYVFTVAAYNSLGWGPESIACSATPRALGCDAVIIKDTAKKLDNVTILQSYYDPAPLFNAQNVGTVQSLATGTYVYNMGDIINGKLTFVPTLPWQVTLMDFNGASYDYQRVPGGLADFSVASSNVLFDGPYYLKIESMYGEFPSFTTATCPIYFKYNVVWAASAIVPCEKLQTISGWVSRGNGSTITQDVVVYLVGPSGKTIKFYEIPAGSSGQFSLTFMGQKDPGYYRVYLRDQYYDDAGWKLSTGSFDNDALIYKTVSTIPSDFAIKASIYVNPVYLYSGIADQQSIVLALVDGYGNPVTGALMYAKDTLGTTLGSPTVYGEFEIAPGYYIFKMNLSSYAQPDIRFSFKKTLFGKSFTSNSIIVSLRTPGAWNPYIQVQNWYNDMPSNGSQGGTPVCNLGNRVVVDNLPCTIGDSLWIKVGYWAPTPAADWQVYDANTAVTISGPLSVLEGETMPGEFAGAANTPAASQLDGETWTDAGSVADYEFSANEWYRVRINKAGKISASISVSLWQRQDPAFPISATNACCKEFEKSFDICTVESCTTTKIALAGGAQTSDTAIQVGKKADLVLNVDPTGAPADLFCGCNSKIVRVFMVDADCNIIPGAFTMDVYGGGTPVSLSELWYNGIPGAVGMTSADGSVTFKATTPNVVIVDNCSTLTFRGVKFNYPTGTPCGYQIVVQVFGEQKGFDQCGVLPSVYPFISETIDDISIDPAVTTLTSTATIFEEGLDPSQILAGVPATIEFTDPKFTVNDPAWKYQFKAVGADSFSTYTGALVTLSTTDTGYKVTFSCPFAAAGTFRIYGYAYDDDCLTMEKVIIDVDVVMPTFTVKLGLLDGTYIDNDHILTAGFGEVVSVTATDPRTDGHHDFSTDPNWKLTASARKDACGLYTSQVCTSSVTGCVGCTGNNAIVVTGYDNPCLEGMGKIRLYFKTYDCASLKVDDFTLASASVKVSPEDVAFTIPASATHVTFAVKDAHGHGAPGVTVSISGNNGFASGASGYSFTAGTVTTGKDPSGEADWAFVPPFSGKYTVVAGTTYCSTLVTSAPSWVILDGTTLVGVKGIDLGASLNAKYQAPVVDTTAPTITVDAGLDGSTVAKDVVIIKGSVKDDIGVTQLYVGNNKVDILPDGTFMASVKLAAGLNTIPLVAYDAAGNKGAIAVKITYTAPVDTSITLVLTIGTDIVSVNGKATSIDAAPEIINGSTFVPIRFIAESFGAVVDWLPETQGITITLGDHTIGLQVGNATAVIDGSIVSLSAAPYIKNGRTMVPLRVISEAFGGDVRWDPATRTITIVYLP